MGARHSISEMIRYLCFLLLLYFSKLPTMNGNVDRLRTLDYNKEVDGTRADAIPVRVR